MDNAIELGELYDILPNRKKELNNIRNKSNLLLSLKEYYDEDDSFMDLMDSISYIIEESAEAANEVPDKDYVDKMFVPLLSIITTFLKNEINYYKDKLLMEQEKAVSALKERSKLITSNISSNENINISEKRLNNSIDINNLLKEVLEEMKDRKEIKDE